MLSRFVAPILAIIAGLMMLYAFFGPTPSSAQEAACRYELVPTVLTLSAQQVPHQVLEPDSRDRFVRTLSAAIGFRIPPEAVRNVLVANVGGTLIYGLEINGCLSEARALAKPAPAPKRSGMTPAGVFA